MAGVHREVEDGFEVYSGGDLVIGATEVAEVKLLVPGTHRVALDERVRVATSETGVDEREEQALREEEAVTLLEVPSHPLGIDD